MRLLLLCILYSAEVNAPALRLHQANKLQIMQSRTIDNELCCSLPMILWYVCCMQQVQ